MNDRITLHVNPEFSYELALVIPYVKWLSDKNMLEHVYVPYGMTPFYFFTDRVTEMYDRRSVDNGQNGVNALPNNWIHHNAMAVMGKDYQLLTEEEKRDVNGVLDYKKWTPPNYREKYQNDKFKYGKDFIVISNRYNYEHGKPPRGYFDIECLYNMFNMLTEAGYHVIYKRPQNTEFPIDENEQLTLSKHMQLEAEVDGVGLVTDKKLVTFYENVHDLDSIVYNNGGNYNLTQLQVFANARGFISMAGGNGIFCSYFGVPNITYVTTSGELRDGYFDGDSYYRMLSQAPIYAVRDDEKEISKRGHRNYEKIYDHINDVFL